MESSADCEVPVVVEASIVVDTAFVADDRETRDWVESARACDVTVLSA